MLLRLRRFLDVRAGEGLPVLLSFLYIAFVFHLIAFDVNY